jgi:hypothetical protein
MIGKHTERRRGGLCRRLHTAAFCAPAGCQFPVHNAAACHRHLRGLLHFHPSLVVIGRRVLPGAGHPVGASVLHRLVSGGRDGWPALFGFFKPAAARAPLSCGASGAPASAGAEILQTPFCNGSTAFCKGLMRGRRSRSGFRSGAQQFWAAVGKGVESLRDRRLRTGAAAALLLSRPCPG